MRRLLTLLLSAAILRAQEFDLVIRHARLVDGTGAPAVDGDVAGRGDRIAAVGKFDGTGRTEIDVADLVVFDPATVSDPSTYDDPHHYAVGFSDVIVNGVPVIRAEKLTDA